MANQCKEKIEEYINQDSMIKRSLTTQSQLNAQQQFIQQQLNKKTLRFNDGQYEREFNDFLFQQTPDQDNKPINFKQNTLILATFFIVMISILLAQECLNLTVHNKDDVYLYVSLVLLFCIASLVTIVAIYLVRSLKKNKYAYLIASLIISLQLYLNVFRCELINQIPSQTCEERIDRHLIIISILSITYLTLQKQFLFVVFINTMTVIIYVITSIIAHYASESFIMNTFIISYMGIVFIYFSYQRTKNLKVSFSNIKFKQKQSEIGSQRENISDTDFKVSRRESNLNSDIFHRLIQLSQNKEGDLNEIEKASLAIFEVIRIIKAIQNSDQIINLKGELSDAKTNLENALKILLTKDNLYHYNIENRLQKESEEVQDYSKYIEQNFKSGFQQQEIQLIQKERRNAIQVQNKNFQRTVTLSLDYKVPEMKNILKSIGTNWNFDVFFLKKITDGKALQTLCTFVSKHMIHLQENLGINEAVFQLYFQIIESKYNHNPYHNSAHAADVVNSFYFFIINSKIKPSMDYLDDLAGLIACAGHDVGHPALNNRFLVNNSDEIAITYNDISVLENMHCCIVFKEMKKLDQANILKSLNQQSYQYVRKMIIEMILETDMSKHFDSLGKFRSIALSQKQEFQLEKIENKMLIFKTAIKCADIGHSCKDFELHYK